MDILAKNRGLASLFQVRLDCRVFWTPREQDGDTSRFLLCCFVTLECVATVGVHWGEFSPEPPEELCGSENVSRVRIHKAVSCIMNYLFRREVNLGGGSGEMGLSLNLKHPVPSCSSAVSTCGTSEVRTDVNRPTLFILGDEPRKVFDHRA